MKNLFLFFVAQVFFLQLQAQHSVAANDRFNITYLGLDNPISIAVENCACKNIVLTVRNGTITGKDCKYVFRGKEVGAAYIEVYRKTNKGLKKVDEHAFRVKRLPPPTFKIGPYDSSNEFGDSRKVQKIVLTNQQYVRAELDGSDFELKFIIDSFSVRIFKADSAKIFNFKNDTGKISPEILGAFADLKKDDVVFFSRIFAKYPDRSQMQLSPLLLTIDQ